MEQSEGKLTNPLGLGAAAAVIAVTLVALVALAGLLPLNRSPKTQETLAPATTTNPREPVGNAARPASTTEGPAAAGLCTTCGIVESVRAFEVRGEAAGAGKTVHRVTIRMDDGSYRTISHPVAPGYSVGEKVRIIDGSVVPRR